MLLQLESYGTTWMGSLMIIVAALHFAVASVTLPTFRARHAASAISTLSALHVTTALLLLGGLWAFAFIGDVRGAKLHALLHIHPSDRPA